MLRLEAVRRLQDSITVAGTDQFSFDTAAGRSGIYHHSFFQIIHLSIQLAVRPHIFIVAVRRENYFSRVRKTIP